MMNISEMIIEIYLLESALLKTEKLINLKDKKVVKNKWLCAKTFFIIQEKKYT